MHPHVYLKLGSETFDCRWSVSNKYTSSFQHPLWQSVDIIVYRICPSKYDENLGEKRTAVYALCDILADVDGVEFMSKLLSYTVLALPGRIRAAKVIIPRVQGYIVRSDIIPLRMVDCPHLVHTASLAEPRTWFSGEKLVEPGIYHLQKIFQAAAGGMILDTDERTAETISHLDAIENEICNRLSFPWLLEKQRPKQTLAFVGNYLKYPGHGGTGANHYSAAKALGINMVVLDAPGCWLEDPKHIHLRKAFLPVNLNRDDELPTRILDALSRYEGKIDGIVTFHESLSGLVARAAQRLSLPTLPPIALSIANDKYRVSIMEGHFAHLVASNDDALEIAKQSGLNFPLILKPCRGGSSEGVRRADNALEVVAAAREIISLGYKHGQNLVIEEYCEGPEVDVNLVLCDGKVLFAEVCDDFPKRGDPESTFGKGSSFLETAMVYPSKLPLYEQDMLVKSLHRSLLRLGLQSGVFHLEARVKDSGMAYAVKDGIMDLDYRLSTGRPTTPSCWMIEINARPPGKVASDAVEVTYGIDYVGLGLLFPLGDKERLNVLSHPFLQGSQYWCQVVLFPVETGGTFDSDSICDELKHRKPDLAQYISTSECYFRKGDLVPCPSSGATAWIACFTVFSRIGRVHLLGICESIRQNVRYSIK